MADKEHPPAVVWKPFSELRPHPLNPRIHPEVQIEHLSSSFNDFGDAKISISFQKSTGYVLTGHAVMEAKKRNGEIGAWAMELDLPDGVAEAWMSRDNRIGEESFNDPEKLLELMEQIDESDIDIEMAGYSQDDLEDLLLQMSDMSLPTAPPAPPGTPFDLYRPFQFGDYRGQVEIEVYRSFVVQYQEHQQEVGEVMLTDVLKSWLGLEVENSNGDEPEGNA